MAWIDVNDKLPTNNADVLVYTRMGCSVGHYDSHAGNWRNERDYPLRLRVTHWRELPGPPRGYKTKTPEPRACRDCKQWHNGKCINPCSPRFTDATGATDGCTPEKKARENWL